MVDSRTPRWASRLQQPFNSAAVCAIQLRMSLLPAQAHSQAPIAATHALRPALSSVTPFLERPHFDVTDRQFVRGCQRVLARLRLTTNGHETLTSCSLAG